MYRVQFFTNDNIEKNKDSTKIIARKPSKTHRFFCCITSNNFKKCKYSEIYDYSQEGTEGVSLRFIRVFFDV